MRCSPSGRPTMRRLAALLAGGALVASGAGAATLFEDDFEAYAAGSMLQGQGGWIGYMDPVQINDSDRLGGSTSRVLDGLTAGRLGQRYGSALHGFEAPGGRYEMSFDAFAYNTRNTWGGLSSLSEGSDTRVDTGVFWLEYGGWHLLIRDAGVVVVDHLVGSIGAGPVHLSITIDPVSRQVFGVSDHATATPTFDVSAHFVDALDGVNFGVDYRNREPSYPGLQVDNLRVVSVSAVPEGGTRALMLAGALALTGWLRRCAPRRDRRPLRGAAVQAPSLAEPGGRL